MRLVVGTDLGLINGVGRLNLILKSCSIQSFGFEIYKGLELLFVI